jgi:hypothetical protein
LKLKDGQVSREVVEDLTKILLEEQLKQRRAAESGKVGDEDTEIQILSKQLKNLQE